MSNSLQTMDYSPPGSSVQGILQARILEWVHPFPSPGDLSNPVIEPGSAFQADFLLSELPREVKQMFIEWPQSTYSVLESLDTLSINPDNAA